MEDTKNDAGALGSNAGLGAGAEARCMCKDRALSACPGEWEPGCDLGNNPAHVRVVPCDDDLLKLAKARELLLRCDAGFSSYIMGRRMARKERDKLRSDISAWLLGRRY